MYPTTIPAGYELDTEIDGKPKLVKPGPNCPAAFFLGDAGHVHQAHEAISGVFNGWRYALKQRRTLINFQQAAEAHEDGKDILCEGRPDFAWSADAANPFYDNGVYGLRAWMFSRNDYYVA